MKGMRVRTTGPRSGPGLGPLDPSWRIQLLFHKGRVTGDEAVYEVEIIGPERDVERLLDLWRSRDIQIEELYPSLQPQGAASPGPLGLPRKGMI